MANDGTVIASIGAGAVDDMMGNTSAASTSVDNVVTYDEADPPTITPTNMPTDVPTSTPTFTPTFTPTSTPVPPFAAGYICMQFNHPDSVSYNSNERPHITVQFGNCGQVPVTNVRLSCGVADGPASIIDPTHTHGAFSSVDRNHLSLSFSGRDHLPVGQNYNISFTLNPGSGASRLICSVTEYAEDGSDTLGITTR